MEKITNKGNKQNEHFYTHKKNTHNAVTRVFRLNTTNFWLVISYYYIDIRTESITMTITTGNTSNNVNYSRLHISHSLE